MLPRENGAALRANLARMLDEYAADQAALQRSMWNGKPGRFRYVPTVFHDAAVRALGHGSDDAVARCIHSVDMGSYLGVVETKKAI